MQRKTYHSSKRRTVQVESGVDVGADVDGADPQIQRELDPNRDADAGLVVERAEVHEKVGPRIEMRRQWATFKVRHEHPAPHAAMRCDGKVCLACHPKAAVKLPGNGQAAGFGVVVGDLESSCATSQSTGSKSYVVERGMDGVLVTEDGSLRSRRPSLRRGRTQQTSSTGRSRRSGGTRDSSQRNWAPALPGP